MPTSPPPRAARRPDAPPRGPGTPLRSFLLRIVEERTVRVVRVYELHDIATGTRRRFSSLAALERHLARQGPA